MSIISRRSVLSLFPLSVFAFLSSSSSLRLPAQEAREQEEGGLMPIPGWARAEIDQTLARFREWKGGDDVVAVPLITDIHSETHRGGTVSGDPAEIDWSDTKSHIYIAQHAAVRFGADFIADLGDIGLDRYSDYTPCRPEDLFWRLAAQQRLYQDFTAVPVLFALGNHDHGPDRFQISSRVYGEAFNLPTLRRGVPIKTGPDFDYGCYDLPDKAVRAFFLNTSDGAYYGYSPRQLQFLADNLRLPPGWTAVIFQHFCVDRSIGVWLSAPHIRANRGEIWTAILQGFLHNEAGESDGVSWDFTGNSGSRLAGCITGDSHFDNQGTIGGVNHVITQGFGTVQESNMPEGAVNTKFDTAGQTLIDVAAIKPKTGELRMFRIGAGGAERDRAFSF